VNPQNHNQKNIVGIKKRYGGARGRYGGLEFWV